MKKMILAFILSLISSIAYADSVFVPSQASEIETNTTNFNTNLSSADTDIQKALDTLDDAAGGSGDSISVNSSGATNANFLDNIYMDWALDTAPTPDDITSKFNYNAASGDVGLAANEVAWSLNGLVSEGVTADTIEGRFAFPDWAASDKTITFQDATHTVVGRDTTDTLTNKTLAAASNVIEADTAVALAANGSNCSSGNAPLGVDASGASEACTDFEEDLSNSAGLLAALSDETGTGLSVFGTSPTITLRDTASAAPTADGDFGYDRTAEVFEIGDGASTRYAAEANSVGDALLAVALAANGSNCSAGNAPLGVDASGAVESCTDFEEDLSNSAGLLAALSDETGTGVAVFGTSPTIAAPIETGKIDRNDVAVDDDDCTGEQGLYWYDTTDSAFEFCNAAGGAPTVLGGGAGAPTDADYLVGTANGSLSAEIVVGTSPGGELGNTWASPTIDDNAVDIDELAGITDWGDATTKTTADLTISGIEVDFEAGASEGYPRLAQSATPPATDCDAAGEAGRLYADTDADTNGSVFYCTGAGGWKDIDDDGAGGNTNAYVHLPVGAAKLPTTNPCVIDNSENNVRLLCDASTAEDAFWQFVMPQDYGSSLALRVQYSMTSAVSGGVSIDVDVMAVTPADAADINANSYDTVNNCDDATVPGTAGYLDVITCALTNADSAAAGDLMKVRVQREVADASDTATGDMELVGAILEYTKA